MSLASFRKTLLIGMGGSGHKVAAHFKGRLMEMYGCIPPAVQILCIDTTPSKEVYEARVSGTKIELHESEFVALSVRDPLKGIRQSKQIQSWWIDETPTAAIMNGAGAIRIIGRLAEQLGYHLLQPKIAAKHMKLSNPFLKQEMEAKGFDFRSGMVVYLVGSIAGGSGAGMFLDLSFLCRELFGSDIVISAYLVTSEVFKDLPFTHRAGANCYASLMELEYYMTCNDRQSRTTIIPGLETISLGGQTLKTDHAPLNVVHLLDGRTNIDNQVQSARDLYAHIAECLVVTCGAVGGEMADVEANIRGVLPSGDKQAWERPARFSSVGYSALVFPTDIYVAIEQMDTVIELAKSAVKTLRLQKEAPPAAATALSAAAPSTVQAVKDFVIEQGLELENPQKLIEKIAKLSAREFALTLPDAMDMTLSTADQQVRSYATGQVKKLERETGEKIEKAFQSLQQRMSESVRAALAGAARQAERDQTASGLQGQLAAALLDVFTAWRKAIMVLRNNLSSEETDAESQMSKCQDAMKQLMGKAGGWFGQGGLNKQKRAIAEAFVTGAGKLMAMKMNLLLLDRAVAVCDTMMEILKQAVNTSEEKARTSQDFTAIWESIRSMAEQKYSDLWSKLSRRNPVEIPIGRGNEDETAASHKNPIYRYAKVPKPAADYATFLKDMKAKNIQTLPNDVPQLAEMAVNWADTKVAELRKVTALEVLNAMEKQEEGYIHRKVRDAMELAMPLWRYNQDEVRGQTEGAKVCHIITAIGVNNTQEARDLFDTDIVNSIPSRRIHQPCYSKTQDTSHIFFVNYEAVLPLYVLDGLAELKKDYDRMLVPPTHIDKRMQFCLPDLLPENKVEDRAFEVLALGIVPEMKCIKERKDPGRKKEFLITDRSMCAKGETINLRTVYGISTTFGDAVEYLAANPLLLGKLGKLVDARRKQLKKSKKLRAAALRQAARLAKLLIASDFSRQLTGRYIYREIQLLLNEAEDTRSVPEYLASLT